MVMVAMVILFNRVTKNINKLKVRNDVATLI